MKNEGELRGRGRRWRALWQKRARTPLGSHIKTIYDIKRHSVAANRGRFDDVAEQWTNRQKDSGQHCRSYDFMRRAVYVGAQATPVCSRDYVSVSRIMPFDAGGPLLVTRGHFEHKRVRVMYRHRRGPTA